MKVNTIRKILFVSVYFLILLTLSCSKELPEEIIEQEQSDTKIIFSLSGRGIASSEDLETRYIIEKKLVEKKIGEIVSTGADIAKMEIVLKLKDNESTNQIHEIIRSNYPKAKYVIQ